MDLKVQNFLGFNNLQTALEEGNQLIKKITPIKVKYAHKRKLVINFLNSLMITMNRKDINWRLQHTFYFTQCLEIFSRAALQLGIGLDFVKYIDELWAPIQKDNFILTTKTPPWAIEIYVNKILSIIENVENSEKRDKLFTQISSPILNVLLLQPSFEVQVVMWHALKVVLKKVSNHRNTFINLLRNFTDQDTAMRFLIETYLKNKEFTTARSRKLVRAINLKCNTFKIYTLICISVTINNNFISPCDNEIEIYANFALAHKSISLQIKKIDLNYIFGEPLHVDDNIYEVLYIYFDCIQTIFYYPHKTNANLICIEIKFTNCFPLSYAENTALKKLCCTVFMNEEQLATFLKMLENFQIDDKLKLNNGPEKIFRGISVTRTGNNLSSDIINTSDDNLLQTTTPNINIPEPEIITTQIFKGTFLNKALGNYDVSPSSTDKAAAKKRKLVTTSTPTESSSGNCVRSTNRMPSKRRRLSNRPYIALEEQPEPISFALNMSQNPRVECIIGINNLEESSPPQDHSVLSNDSCNFRTNSNFETQQTESPVEKRSSVNYVVSTTSNDSFSCSNLEKQSQCSHQPKSPVNEYLSSQDSISINYNLEKQSSPKGLLRPILSQRIESTVNKNDSFSQRLVKSSEKNSINYNLEKQSSSKGRLRSILSQRIESTVNKNDSFSQRLVKSSEKNSINYNLEKQSSSKGRLRSILSQRIESTVNKNDSFSLDLVESSETNSMFSQKSESRIVQVRSQDTISSNSVDGTAVNATTQSSMPSYIDCNLFNKKIFIRIPNSNKNAINAKMESTKSSQASVQLSNGNTSSAVVNLEEIQGPLSVANPEEIQGPLSVANPEEIQSPLSVANPEEIQGPLPVASSQKSNNALVEPQWQCGKHFSILTPSSSSYTQSSTENVTEGYTQHIQKLYAELNTFTEPTAINQQINLETFNKAIQTIFNTLISYNKYLCKDKKFMEQFEQDQDVFKDLCSNFRT